MTASTRRPLRRGRAARGRCGNGARLFVLENRFNPTLALSGSLRAGRIYAPPDRRLIASVAAGELMKGTARRTKLQLAEDLEAPRREPLLLLRRLRPGRRGHRRQRPLARRGSAARRAGRGPPHAGLSGRGAREGEEAPGGSHPPAAGTDLRPRLRGGDAPHLSGGAPSLSPHGRGADREGRGARSRRPRGVLPRALRRRVARHRAGRRRGCRPRPRSAGAGARGVACGTGARARAAAGAGARAGSRDRRDARQGERRRRARPCRRT